MDLPTHISKIIIRLSPDTPKEVVREIIDLVVTAEKRKGRLIEGEVKIARE